jgi:hypothetical protein
MFALNDRIIKRFGDIYCTKKVRIYQR